MRYHLHLLALATLVAGCAGVSRQKPPAGFDPTHGGKRKIVLFQRCRIVSERMPGSGMPEDSLWAGVSPGEFDRRIDSAFFTRLREDAKAAHLEIDTVASCDSSRIFPSASGKELSARFPARLPGDTSLFLALGPLEYRMEQKVPGDTTTLVLFSSSDYALYDPKPDTVVADGTILSTSRHPFAHGVGPSDWYSAADNTAYQLISRLLEFR